MVKWPDWCRRSTWIVVLLAAVAPAQASKLLIHNDSVTVVDVASSNMTLETSSSKPTAYIDASKITQGNFRSDEPAIEKLTLAFLAERFALVPTEATANYVILIRANDYLDYGTRNSRRIPSNTLITILTCKMPSDGDRTKIDFSKDCRSIESHFYSSDTIIAKMTYALGTWWKYLSP